MIHLEKFSKKFHRLLRVAGPGLITGAADDDPSGIATYSQTGAQFGLNQLWTVLFILPLMTVVQESCARIGAVTGKGLAAVVREHYPPQVLYAVVFLVLIANTLNIGADIGAMAAASSLVLPLPFSLLLIIFTSTILLLEIFTSYKIYARILKWLALTLLAYPLTLLIVSANGKEVLKATFWPHFEFNFTFLFILIGVLGTTISPYLFFWEAAEEVEEEKEKHLFHGGKPKISSRFLRNLRLDNFLGMVSSQAATWCIIVVAASTLHLQGLTEIRTAADAAKALEPLVVSFPNAGFLAKSIFAVGIVGLGLLAVPVLSGSAAYCLAEALNFREGLNLKLKRAHGFYGVITLATILGLGINYLGFDPIQALVYTAVINGVVSVPLIFLIAKMARNPEIMGEFRVNKIYGLLLWTTFLVMLTSAASMLWFLKP